jgi:hypothetical protein
MIVATQEVEIQRIVIWSQLRQVVLEPYLEKSIIKKGLASGQSVGPELEPQYCKKKKGHKNGALKNASLPFKLPACTTMRE